MFWEGNDPVELEAILRSKDSGPTSDFLVVKFQICLEFEKTEYFSKNAVSICDWYLGTRLIQGRPFSIQILC